ncbi:hypothetical protein COJ85_04925 [Bacillus sp. AFS076308]|uniref:hypothetical protein n=1 Tax=Bacillus sp. AFS076308 TaxID=2033512 RepID=UPI000BF67E93|nr:hypothetical protein [Bacillus sp. AFS076308]PFO08015.1 hypothetical protein COJ85_04925 [Bacillus sp. AFS076308]
MILGAGKLVGPGLTCRFCRFTCHYKKIPAKIVSLPAILKIPEDIWFYRCIFRKYLLILWIYQPF